jgi:hypothetical protein
MGYTGFSRKEISLPFCQGRRRRRRMHEPPWRAEEQNSSWEEPNSIFDFPLEIVVDRN